VTRDSWAPPTCASPIGFGAWAIAGRLRLRWGRRTIRFGAADSPAIDAGINWIDTAAVYGLGRIRARRRLASGLGSSRRPTSSRSARSCGTPGRDFPLPQAASVRKELEDSSAGSSPTPSTLQIHWSKPWDSGACARHRRGLEHAGRLQKEGKVRTSRCRTSTSPKWSASARRAHREPAASLLDAAPRIEATSCLIAWRTASA